MYYTILAKTNATPDEQAATTYLDAITELTYSSNKKIIQKAQTTLQTFIVKDETSEVTKGYLAKLKAMEYEIAKRVINDNGVSYLVDAVNKQPILTTQVRMANQIALLEDALNTMIITVNKLPLDVLRKHCLEQIEDLIESVEKAKKARKAL